MSDNRFVQIYSQKSLWGPTMTVLVDRKTGVNYLFAQNGNQAGAITPLLDRDGKPVVSSVPIEE